MAHVVHIKVDSLNRWLSLCSDMYVDVNRLETAKGASEDVLKYITRVPSWALVSFSKYLSILFEFYRHRTTIDTREYKNFRF